MNEKNKRGKTCCFSGYRPHKLPWGSNENDVKCRKLKLRLYDIVSALYYDGMRHFICGMALGCDTYFCEAVLKLRDEHRDVTLEAAIPFEGQAKKWSEDDRKRYEKLISLCDISTVITDLKERESESQAMFSRNRYMVNNSSVLISVYDGRRGGTMYTINYARKMGLEIIEIPPIIDNN